MAPRKGQPPQGPDLFSVDRFSYTPLQLSGRDWPGYDQFPVNHSRATVREHVRADLIKAEAPILVAGFSSINELIDLATAWSLAHENGVVRIMLGSEPFTTERTSFRNARLAFADEIRDYWQKRGISLSQSAKVLAVLDLIEGGRLTIRALPGTTRLHAKLYIGEGAATLGSSNFTRAGLSTQAEANVRFAATSEPKRFNGVVQLAENYWSVGEDWNAEFVELLTALLQVVSWPEALARASSDILEGEWAKRYVSPLVEVGALWPSQQQGIAQALWIAENVGSVLVADATGSGKTRMGAHLVRAVHDRLWGTGRIRTDLTVVVSPPLVLGTWKDEALSCGLMIVPVSHGQLSRDDEAAATQRLERRAVANAQILAVDEAHNFLRSTTKRSRRIRDSGADHVLLFTATPINRDASDLLELVNLLGADNFDDETLAILDQLERRRSRDNSLAPAERDRLRRAIQHFTVRRTKAELNALVDREPDAYRHPRTGRPCRYPTHHAHRYSTGETPEDAAVANLIRDAANSLRGLTMLGDPIAVPAAVRYEYTDPQWLEFRIATAPKLAAYHVLDALRSSRAALIEHVLGTEAARSRFDLPEFKREQTGRMLDRLVEREQNGPPAVELACEIPPWLTDPQQWAEACRAEQAIYRAIADGVDQLSDSRETAKADLLVRLTADHKRIIVFDRHPITLFALAPRLIEAGIDPVVATGSTETTRKRVQRLFRADSEARAVALCSDAMNEGLNLQGASAIVHLDLPTTMRVAEQRVGRIDRMDSPHDAIHAYWPEDGSAFITRADELLARRAEESANLLGANLLVPGLENRPIDLQTAIDEAERAVSLGWDGLHDALEPVRRLVVGDTAIVPPRIYDEYRESQAQVLARVAPLGSSRPWAFLAIASTAHGAPRWLLLDGPGATPIIDLHDIAHGLRARLKENPPGVDLDDEAAQWLSYYLRAATSHERELLPRRYQRALDQYEAVTEQCARTTTGEVSGRWAALRAVTNSPDDPSQPVADPYLVAERWLEVVRPMLLERVRGRRGRRNRRLSDLTPLLLAHPPDIGTVEARLTDLEYADPLDHRVSACILGVPQGDL